MDQADHVTKVTLLITSATVAIFLLCTINALNIHEEVGNDYRDKFYENGLWTTRRTKCFISFHLELKMTD